MRSRAWLRWWKSQYQFQRFKPFDSWRRFKFEMVKIYHLTHDMIHHILFGPPNPPNTY